MIVCSNTNSPISNMSGFLSGEVSWVSELRDGIRIFGILTLQLGWTRTWNNAILYSLIAESLLTKMSWNKRKPSQPAKCHGKNTSTASQLSHKLKFPWPGEKCGSTLSKRNVFQQWEQLIAWNQKIRDLVMGPCYSAPNCCNQLITCNSIYPTRPTRPS